MATDPTDSAPTPPPPPAATPPPVGGARRSLDDRAKNILLQPAAEWAVIDGEAATVGGLIGGYAAILAVIPPLALLLGMLLSPLGSYIFGATGLLIKLLLIVYAVSLGTVLLLGFAIDALAPSLGGVKNGVQAMKVAVYSGTAFWVGGIGLLLSQWLWLVLGIGYGGYLLWLGLPRLMRVPADKAQAYAGAAIAIWVVIFLVLQQIGWRIAFGAMIGAAMGGMM
jgi:hypothetical protein